MGSQRVGARGGDAGRCATARTNPSLGALRYQGLPPGFSRGPAMLASHTSKHMFVRTTHPKDNLAGLGGVNGVPELSVGGSSRR